jgi:SulP family sulfate permease
MEPSKTGLVPDWIRSYRPVDFPGDLAAGAVVAVILAPQGMAYALLAGLPAIVGLYAATVPLLAYALVG